MAITWRPTHTVATAGLIACIFLAGCGENNGPGTTGPQLKDLSSSNGAAGQMPAFYDGELFTVNMKEMPADASASTIAQNKSINEIYAYNDLDDEQDFTPILDAIQGDGFNPLWQQVLIHFNAGFTPRQLVSDVEVDNAVASGEITLEETDEVYRCSVVGPK